MAAGPKLSDAFGGALLRLSPSILCVQCDDTEALGVRLLETCKALQQESRGRTVSNRGGWQSKEAQLHCERVQSNGQTIKQNQCL